jgi:hypothetical protein
MTKTLILPTMAIRLLILLSLPLLVLSGCRQEDACTDVTCGNGTCLDGVCECAVGFDGPSCQTESRSRYLGSWEAGDICRTTAFVYDLVITSGASAGSIQLDNLNDKGVPLAANIDGLQIEVPTQGFQTGTISGAGGMDTTAVEITMEYRIQKDGFADEVCQVVLRKP